jgi:hypothetical protein
MMAQIMNEAIGGSTVIKLLVKFLELWQGGDFKEVAVNICRCNPAIDFEEVEAVAELAELELADFCMLQMAYEAAHDPNNMSHVV